MSSLRGGRWVGRSVDNSGEVEFRAAPGVGGHRVRVRLTYYPPAGKLGATVAKLFGEAPEQQVRDDLRRFKQVLETGEVVRPRAARRAREPAGRCSARPSRSPLT